MKTTTYRCGLDRCESCGSHRSSRGIGEYQIHDNGQETLVNCSDCSRETELIFPHVYKRVFRDVATRYILRYGGSTFKVQTGDQDYEVYLRNKFGFPIATVSMFDKFPKTPPAFDLPF